MAFTKKNKRGKVELPSFNPRTISAAQRREMFLKQSEAEDENDWKVLKADVIEEQVPYGYLTLDTVLRLKGIPRRGRVIQIHGFEGAGKSTLSYGLAANYQQQTGEPVAIFDFERTSEWEYLKRIGVTPELGKLYMPSGIPDACKKVLQYMKAGTRFFVFDSIPRMKSRIAEKDIMSGEAFDNMQPGRHAKAMVEFFDAMLDYAAEYDCTFVMINQTRARIENTQDARNAQKYPTFTNLPYELPGGKYTRFIMSVMIELKLERAFRAGEPYDEDEFILPPNPAGGSEKGDFIANRVRARVLKNKVNDGGYRQGDLWIASGQGISDNITIRQLARQYGLIDFAGKKWFAGLKESPIETYTSKEAAIKDLVIDQNPEVLNALRPLIAQAVSQDQSNYLLGVDSTLATYLEGQVDVDDKEAAEPVGKGFKVEDAD